MIASLGARSGACASLLLLAAALSVYPADGPWLIGALGAYAALLWYRPAAWLVAVPAVLPILDFAPWTGWFFLVELDLVLLVTCAVGYWRIRPGTAAARVSPLAALALACFIACLAVAAWRGITPLAPIDANAFNNYISPYNGLRILKGFAWAIVLLPLLRHHAGAGLENLSRLFVPGMLLGLVAASLAVAWERMHFPGLLNFSSDYRPTAPFSDMHTGGAALDAYLSMVMPFVAVWLVAGAGRVRLVLGLACLLLVSFAGLTLFSRDIYLAYASSAAVLALVPAWRALRGGQLHPGPVLLGATVLLVLGTCLVQVFAGSGYRGLLAALGTLALALVAGGAAPRAASPLLGGSVGLALVLIVVGIALLAPDAGSNQSKGAYIAYALAFCAGAGGAALLLNRHAGLGMTLLLGALPAIGVATLLVAWHHSGSAALPSAAIALVAIMALVANRWLRRPLWSLNSRSVTPAFCVLIVFATVIPVSAGYYTQERFSTVSRDLQVRLAHWTEALDMMDDDVATQMFGMGLGRFPVTYHWRNTHGETPATYRFEQEGNNLFLRTSAAQYAIGYGDPLRFLQMVDAKAGERYTISVDLRRSGKQVIPRIALCERWLLYPRNCQPLKIELSDDDTGWQHHEGAVTARFSPHPLLGLAPIQLQISNESSSGILDIDNVSMVELTSGRELIANGSFSAAHTSWFFSSDRNHMPWHVKNLALSTIFEMGWLGAMALALLILAAMTRLLRNGLAGNHMSTVLLASLTGAMMVGLFDSVTDVPRLALLLTLLTLAGTLVPAPVQRTRQARKLRAQATDALMS